MTNHHIVEKKYITKESVLLVLGALSVFCSIVVYAQASIEKVEAHAKEELKEKASELQKQIEKETQERQQLADQVNKKLDTIITILATGRSK